MSASPYFASPHNYMTTNDGTDTRSMIYKGNPKMVQYWITISYDVTVMK